MLGEIQECLSKIKMKEETETVRMTETLGRVCAECIYAVMDQPPLPRSPLNDYAVRSQDTTGASEANPVRLNVTGHICAGMYPKLEIGPGEAARIMTGAPTLEGADGVIMQKRTDEGSKPVEIYQPVTACGDYCKKGEDTCREALLMEKGRLTCSSHTGILSSQGAESIPVYPVPMTGIMTTGDELVPVGTPLKPGKIYDGNGPFLAARIKELGTKPLFLGRGGGDAAQLAWEARKQLTEYDALITSGGVSLGVRDYMSYVAEVLGANISFHGINVKPGSPMLAMLVEDRPVSCLSGNPFATITTFEALARPVLERVRGRARWGLEILLGILGNLFPKSFPIRHPVGGKIEDGKARLPEGRHPSGMLSSMAGCNCLVDIPVENGGLRIGEQVKAMFMQIERRASQTAVEFPEIRLRQEICCWLFF